MHFFPFQNLYPKSALHTKNGLDATPLAGSGINDRLIKRHLLISGIPSQKTRRDKVSIFRQKRLWVLIISILPLSFPKVNFLALNFTFLNDNFLTR